MQYGRVFLLWVLWDGSTLGTVSLKWGCTIVTLESAPFQLSGADQQLDAAQTCRRMVSRLGIAVVLAVIVQAAKQRWVVCVDRMSLFPTAPPATILRFRFMNLSS